jgi:hypothetical protein
MTVRHRFIPAVASSQFSIGLRPTPEEVEARPRPLPIRHPLSAIRFFHISHQ